MNTKPFQFKVKRKPSLLRPTSPKVPVERVDEGLMGEVQGKRASAPEERFARALDKAKIEYYFRWIIGEANTLGSVEVDFVCLTVVIQPVSILGEYAHASYSQKEQDWINEVKINEYFADWGAQPLINIQAVNLADQHMADMEVRKNIL